MPLTQTDGRVAVVTGAGSGIGRAMVAHFVEKGMSVAAADIDVAAAAETATEVGGDVISMGVDVADSASVEALAEAAYGEWGRVHLLCNNAGVFQGGLAWERSVDDWAWALGVNMWGIIHGIRSFVPRMLAGGEEGHVVNTSSVAGFVAAANSGPYNVSKVAAFSLSETLAHDLSSVDAKIGASVLCPAAVRTAIAHTDQVRPGGPGDETEDAAFVREMLFHMTETGVDPSDVPPLVLAGIEAGDFVIPTKPSYDNQIQTRFDALLERRLPPTPVID